MTASIDRSSCRWIVLLLAVLVETQPACRREQKRQDVPSSAGSGAAKSELDPRGLELLSSEQVDARVRKAFPNGIATEDARAEIGTASPPPDDLAPDPRAEWVAELKLASALDGATIRRAMPPRPDGPAAGHFVRAQTAGGGWEFVEDDGKNGPYVRVAVTVAITDIDKPVAPAELDGEIAWTRAFFQKLGAGEPHIAVTKAQALARATAAFELRKQLADEVDVGLAILAPDGKTFAGRLVWDVAYSAGFVWGDGDYFHWVPSPNTDISQGIGMGSTSGASYFIPEWVATNDPQAAVDGVEMSFDVARTYDPTGTFEVMMRAAKYMARRLGGRIVSLTLEPFDERAARSRVAAIVKQMKAAGIEPGTGLALQVF